MFGARAIVVKGVVTCNPLSRPSRPPLHSLCLLREYSSSPPEPPEGDLSQRSHEPLELRRPYLTRSRRFISAARRRRSIPYSPTTVLDEIVRLHGGPVRALLLRKVRVLASVASFRVSVLTVQELVRRLVEAGYLNIRIPNLEKTSARLARRGITTELVSHWVWILLAEDSESMIERFVSSDQPRPLFLLNMILGSNRDIRDPPSLLALIVYIKERYLDEIRPTASAIHVELLFCRLIEVCLDCCPALVIPVSELAAQYIRSIPLSTKGANRLRSGYQARCDFFNRTVAILSRSPRIDQDTAREFCWQAQRVLLECSATTSPPLILNKRSYQSIRIVMLGLRKNTQETRVALRASKSWPPYREIWDGTDEKLKDEDTISRSVKAGILMTQAGFSSVYLDDALTALGGSSFGRQPRVQTKTINPRLNICNNLNRKSRMWVAQLEATRNAREAWAEFQNPSIPGSVLSSDVYAVMFEKLFAPPIDDPYLIPGDTKKNLPVYNGNYSTFQIARLEPPHPRVLYRQMLDSGILPTGRCLRTLVRTAERVGDALDYLEDSRFPGEAKVFGRWSYDPSTFTEDELAEAAKVLRRIPVDLALSWIHLLCRLHYHNSDKRRFYIPRAIDFIRLYFHLTGRHHHTTRKAMWSHITWALAREKTLRSGKGGMYDFGATLETFVHAFDEYKRGAKHVDAAIFSDLCFMVTKAVRNLVYIRVRDRVLRHHEFVEELAGEFGQLLADCQGRLVHEFYVLARRVNPERGYELDRSIFWKPLFTIRVRCVRNYVRALGSLGCGDEMVKAVDWLFSAYDHWGDERFLTDDVVSRNPVKQVRAQVMETLAYFDLMAADLVDPGEYTRLKDQLHRLQVYHECKWAFPSEGSTPDPTLYESADTDLETGRLWQQWKASHGSQLKEWSPEEEKLRDESTAKMDASGYKSLVEMYESAGDAQADDMG